MNGTQIRQCIVMNPGRGPPHQAVREGFLKEVEQELDFEGQVEVSQAKGVMRAFQAE